MGGPKLAVVPRIPICVEPVKYNEPVRIFNVNGEATPKANDAVSAVRAAEAVPAEVRAKDAVVEKLDEAARSTNILGFLVTVVQVLATVAVR